LENPSPEKCETLVQESQLAVEDLHSDS